MTYYKSWRIIDGKLPQWVIVDKTGKIANKNPSKDELKDLERELTSPYTRGNKKTNRYTEEQLRNELRRFENEKGRIPTRRDFVNNPGYPSFAAYQKYFGSWSNGLKSVEFDVDTTTKHGIVVNNTQKSRLAEIIVRDHFKQHPIDLAGANCGSPCDGICPNGKFYDVKSSKLYEGEYYHFGTDNKCKEDIEIYYLLGFNEDWTKLDYGWRIYGEMAESSDLYIGMNNRSRAKFNIENMRNYDITDKLKDIFGKKLDFNKM